MKLEFMEGAAIFGLVNALLALLIVYFVYKILTKIFHNIVEPDNPKNIAVEAFFGGAIMIYLLFFSSAAQPKLTINVPPNRALIEYQNTTSEQEIVTPPARTKTLEGFESLKP